MSLHWDVTCDGCEKTNLIGYRYKCLRCDNYDLCSKCHESEIESGDHSRNHPFQCLLDRAARELYFNGGEIPELCADSFTCPICGKMGHAAKELVKHVQSKHLNDNTRVICPLCAAVPSADTVRMNNLVNHVTVMHGMHLRIGGVADNNNQVVSTETAEWPPIERVLAQSISQVPTHAAVSGLGWVHCQRPGHEQGYVGGFGHGRLMGCCTHGNRESMILNSRPFRNVALFPQSWLVDRSSFNDTMQTTRDPDLDLSNEEKYHDTD